ncbi:hypothetical protein OUZ56_030622 [Daphnia magna]|uniref:Apple domain-containing protein n=1 Tax=Daphnia magna TaxID=35525 RepID=A0ABQ9ZRV7_9CRUS|nr:hypothetical protein OUZ56_030622 [Daphnia magna]
MSYSGDDEAQVFKIKADLYSHRLRREYLNQENVRNGSDFHRLIICYIIKFTSDRRQIQQATGKTSDDDESKTAIDWNTTTGGVKWLRNCDFPGYDIKYQFMPIEKCHLKCCSQACMALSGCNAFRWNDGWCFLKKLPSLNRTPVASGTCGFLPHEIKQ